MNLQGQEFLTAPLISEVARKFVVVVRHETGDPGSKCGTCEKESSESKQQEKNKEKWERNFFHSVITLQSIV